MPNWSFNTVRCKEARKKFGCEGKECIDFNYIIPEPQTKEECPIEYQVDKEGRCLTDGSDASIQIFEDRPWFNWFKWRCDNWGTKWNGGDLVSDDSDSDDCIRFDTAWAPPMPLILEVSRKYPNDEITLTAAIEFDYKVCTWKFLNGEEISYEEESMFEEE